jgi:hypothetical protein
MIPSFCRRKKAGKAWVSDEPLRQFGFVVSVMAARRKGSFWIGVFIGFIAMILLGSLPVLGPIIGGFIAGLIARGEIWGGATAGLTSGLIAGIVFLIIDLFRLSLPLGTPSFLTTFGVTIGLVFLVLYFGLLGFAGGAVAGAVIR